MASKRTGIVVEMLAESGLLWHLFPELKKGAGLEQPPSHHLDVFDHNLATLSAMENLQKHPEKYQDLIVRVAGYSDYFNDLGSELQEEIIRRTEHGSS